MRNLLNQLIIIRPIFKKLILIILDISSLFAAYIIVSIILNDFRFIEYYGFLNLSFINLIFIFIKTGQYKGITRYSVSKYYYMIFSRSFYLFLFNFLFCLILDFSIPSYKVLIMLWAIQSTFSSIIRLLIRDLVLNLRLNSENKYKKVVIYGAGSAGIQLSASLRFNKNFKILSFIDDNKELQKREINGIEVNSSSYIFENKKCINQILIAIPSLSIKERKDLILKINKFKIPLLQVPSIDDLDSGKENINSLKPIEIKDLLSREAVAGDPKLLKAKISNSHVLVTGAGGSIGTELCKQIFNSSPKVLCLFEISELKLYEVYEELKQYNKNNVQIISILGDSCDKKLVERIIKKNNIEIIFHAAAYKHVPLVEKNPFQGLTNNIFSTLAICEAAKKTSIQNVLLISSDKAVRPVGIMGASKRISEMIFQAFADEERLNKKSKKTIFSMVRFGNVLGSSGSVVPLFQKQIDGGGPITVTDKNVIRYFMTINEAVQLVIQSLTLAKGGDLFLLDMGEQVKIYDLAQQMILMNGLTIKDKKNPKGDIEIKITGLRPGEKLYEELLISGKLDKTFHPLIFRAEEKFLSLKMLIPKLDELKIAMQNYDLKSTLFNLKKLIPEYEKIS
jgi:FlaA1/EpsC-like NDP-sugar epimerase